MHAYLASMMKHTKKLIFNWGSPLLLKNTSDDMLVILGGTIWGRKERGKRERKREGRERER